MTGSPDRVAIWAQRLLVTYAFTCPWLYGLKVTTDIRIAAVDLLLVPALLLTLLLLRQAHVTWLMLLSALHAVAVAASVMQWLNTDLFAPLFLKSVRMAAILAPAILILVTPLSAIRMVPILRAFYWGGLISIGAGLAGFFLQWESVTAAQTYFYASNVYLRRAGGLFRDSGAYSHLLATWCAAALLLLYYAPGSSRLRQSLFVGSTLAISAVGLYASLSRSAFLNIVVLIGATFVFSVTKSLTPGRILALLGLAACLIASPLLVEFKGEEEGRGMALPIQRIVSTIDSMLTDMDSFDSTGGGRLSSWRMSISIWSERPLLGVGYKALIPVYGIAADNNLVLALVETGLLGAVPLFLLGLLCTYSLAAHYAGRSFAAPAVLAVWLGQLAHSLTADIFTFMSSMPVVLMVVFFYYRLPVRFEVYRTDSRALSSVALVGRSVYRGGAPVHPLQPRQIRL